MMNTYLASVLAFCVWHQATAFSPSQVTTFTDRYQSNQNQGRHHNVNNAVSSVVRQATPIGGYNYNGQQQYYEPRSNERIRNINTVGSQGSIIRRDNNGYGLQQHGGQSFWGGGRDNYREGGYRHNSYAGGRQSFWGGRRDGLQEMQGGSRLSWGRHYNQEQQQVLLETNGTPLTADLQVWEGPNHAPQRIKVWSEDGLARPFRSIVDTPGGRGGVVEIRNGGPMEFPLAAGVRGSGRGSGSGSFYSSGFHGNHHHYGSGSYGSGSYGSGSYGSGYSSGFGSGFHGSYGGAVGGYGRTIQGDSLQYFPVHASVNNVRISLWSEGLPIQATVEVLQGPGSLRQLAEVSTDDGAMRPFSAVLETPGYGCTIIIKNTGPMTYPIKARVESR